MDEQLGTAQVEITASLMPLEKGLAEARQQVERSGNQMSRSLQGFQGDVNKIAQGIAGSLHGMISLFGIGYAAREVFRTLSDDEAAMAQLAARIKSTGEAAGLTVPQLVSLAQGLQETTTYGRAEVESAESLLLTFTNIGQKVFPRALEATLNLSAATGRDLTSSALSLGRALNDPVGGLMLLTREGIMLTAAQKEQIASFVKSGDVARAQGVILDELQRRMGGAATAARDTLGGAFEALAHDAEDLTVALGERSGLAGALKHLADMGAWTAHALASDLNAALSTTPELRAELQRDQAELKALQQVASEGANEKAPWYVRWLADIGSGGSPAMSGLSSAAAQVEKLKERIDEVQKALGDRKLGPPPPSHFTPPAPDAGGARKVDEFAKVRDSLQEAISQQQMLASAYTRGAGAVADAQQQIAIYDEVQRAGLPAGDKRAEQLRQLATVAELDKAAVKNLADAQRSADERQSRDLEETKRLLSDVETPQQKYNAQIRELDRLFSQGALSLDQYQQVQQKYAAELGKGLNQSSDQAKKLQGAFESAGRSLSSGFIDAIVKGQDLRSVFQQLGQDLARMLLQTFVFDQLQSAVQSAVNPLAKMETSALNSIGGAVGNWLYGGGSASAPSAPGSPAAGGGGAAVAGSFGAMLAAGAAWLFGHGTSPAAAAPSSSGPMLGTDMLGGQLIGPGFATGGSFDVGGAGGTDSQLVAFRATPGEHVQVGSHNSALASPLSVVVEDHAGVRTSARHTRSANGGRELRLTISDMMAQDIYERGALSRSLESQLNGVRAPIQR